MNFHGSHSADDDCRYPSALTDINPTVKNLVEELGNALDAAKATLFCAVQFLELLKQTFINFVLVRYIDDRYCVALSIRITKNPAHHALVERICVEADFA